MRFRTRFLWCALAAALYLGRLVAAGPGSLEWRVRTGTDLIGEQFHLIDDDTLDLTTEFRTELQTRWRYGGLGAGLRWRDVDLDHRVGIGTETLRHDFSGSAIWNPDSAWHVDMRGLTLARYYLDDAGGTRSNFVQGRFQAILRREPFDENASWGIDQGVEGAAYGNRSSVFLNGLRHWHGLVVDGQRGFDFYGGRVVLEHERIPDSTALDYVGVGGDLYGTWSPSLSWDASGEVAFTGRRYRNPQVRPHESTLTAHTRLGWRLLADWSVEVDPTLTVASYDPADSIYYSHRRIAPAISLVWWPTWGSVRVGPRAAWQRSRTFRGEDYAEWGFQASVNLFSSERGFLDLTTEVGWRDYLHDEEAFFTDHRYWDTTLLLTGHLPWGLQLDTFVTFRAESHPNAVDNTRSILVAVDLSRALDR